MFDLDYDVIIVGAGPAGIFCALELIKFSRARLRISILERGKSLEDRIKERDFLRGWGGAGLFSDGKITLSTQIGGWLGNVISEGELEHLIRYVDSIWCELSPESRVITYNSDAVEELMSKARRVHVKLVPYTVRHIGSDNTPKVLKRAESLLKSNVDIFLEKCVEEIEIDKSTGLWISRTNNGEKYRSRYLVLAPGRVGAQWLMSQIKKLGAKLSVNPVDIGVRVETTYESMEDVTNILYDPKFLYNTPTYDDIVRTFCVNPRGFVIKERYEDVITTNGHSYVGRKSGNTNFAVLVSSYFTEPFKDPIAYGKHIARLANLLSGGSVLVQRLGDLKRGRRSTKERILRSVVEPTLEDAVPGDISFALPHRHLVSILEFLKALDSIAPGVYSDDTLLYAVEVKFYSSHIEVTRELEVKGLRNIYVCGDGAGITRGLAQSSVSGVIAARSILRKEGISIKNK